MSEDLNTKSLGEKLFEARKAAKMTYIENWADLLNHERAEHEIAALAFSASLSHDETANAVITDLRQRLQAAEERAEKLEGALNKIADQYVPDQSADVDLAECHRIASAALKTEGA